MGKKLGTLIKSARNDAGLTQEQLARKVKGGCTASDISGFERGVSEPTQTQVKAIAKATGVTQKSLLDAMPAAAKKTTSSTAKKPASSTAKKSTTTTRKPASSTAKKSTTSTAKKSTSTAKKSTTSTTRKSTASKSSMQVTKAEKRLLELYREADSDTKKKVVNILKGGEDEGFLSAILDFVPDHWRDDIQDVIPSGFFGGGHEQWPPKRPF